MSCKWRHPVARRSPGRVEVVTLSARICGRLPRRRRGSRRHRYEVRAFSRRYHEKRRSGVSTYRSDIIAIVHHWCTVGNRRFVISKKRGKTRRKEEEKKEIERSSIARCSVKSVREGGFCFFLCVCVCACVTAKARKNVTSDIRKKERERKTNKHGSPDNSCVRCAGFVNVRQMTVRWSMCSKHGWGASGHPEPRRLVRIRIFAPWYRGFAARHLRHRWEFAGSKERQGEYLLRIFYIFVIVYCVSQIEREVWKHLKMELGKEQLQVLFIHILCAYRKSCEEGSSK